MISADDLACLAALERSALWLATWTIHHANHLRESRDGLKVGGHQASSASMATLLAALYLHELRPEDRVAVKPHASPVYHALQYLLGRQGRDQLERFRSLGGAQAYPSRTKDHDDVDFSTGSVGLGAAMASFSALARDYLGGKPWLREPGSPAPAGRMVALVGEAELDEGNVYEALLEGWKHGARDLWWIVDYNRQSLDAVVADGLDARLEGLFAGAGFKVVTLRYGLRLQAAFRQPGGDALKAWLDGLPNALYSALVYQGGAAFRARIAADIGARPGVTALLAAHGDDELHALLTNLGGHDLEAILGAFAEARGDSTPTCFLAWTIKGHRLPLAGHKDNHAGQMTGDQMAGFQAAMGVAPGQEWEPFAAAGPGVDPARLREFVGRVPFARPGARQLEAPPIEVPGELPVPGRGAAGGAISTQQGFGQILGELARLPRGSFVDRIVTTSPDVTVSTNLGAWVNRRGVHATVPKPDVFADERVVSAQKWQGAPAGQHIELGIAENNLFLLLAALGLSGPLFGTRLLPVGTVYDPFISRGLDALNYACYQGARFLLAGTPSGISLAAEGGAHQSIVAPLLGIGQPGLASFEPAYVDELAVLMAWALRHIARDDGGAVYLRLSTRPLAQPERALTPALRQAIVDGGYWVERPAAAAPVIIAYAGTVAPEANEARARLATRMPAPGLLAVTSADRLLGGWRAAQAARRGGDAGAVATVEALLAEVPRAATIVTVHDGHPAALAWLGAVRGHRVIPLGVERFGQSGDLLQLFAEYGLDAAAITSAGDQGADGAALEAPGNASHAVGGSLPSLFVERAAWPLAPLRALWAQLGAGVTAGVTIDDLVVRAAALALHRQAPAAGATAGAVGIAASSAVESAVTTIGGVAIAPIADAHRRSVRAIAAARQSAGSAAPGAVSLAVMRGTLDEARALAARTGIAVLAIDRGAGPGANLGLDGDEGPSQLRCALVAASDRLDGRRAAAVLEEMGSLFERPLSLVVR